jgi:hypothetical protein
MYRHSSLVYRNRGCRLSSALGQRGQSKHASVVIYSTYTVALRCSFIIALLPSHPFLTITAEMAPLAVRPYRPSSHDGRSAPRRVASAQRSSQAHSRCPPQAPLQPSRDLV